MDEIDQGSLHPILDHPIQTCPGPGFKPTTSCTASADRHSSKELSRQFQNFLKSFLLIYFSAKFY
jgi:hypothetical protein